MFTYTRFATEETLTADEVRALIAKGEPGAVPCTSGRRPRYSYCDHPIAVACVSGHSSLDQRCTRSGTASIAGAGMLFRPDLMLKWKQTYVG